MVDDWEVPGMAKYELEEELDDEFEVGCKLNVGCAFAIIELVFDVVNELVEEFMTSSWSSIGSSVAVFPRRA